MLDRHREPSDKFEDLSASVMLLRGSAGLCAFANIFRRPLSGTLREEEKSGVRRTS